MSMLPTAWEPSEAASARLASKPAPKKWPFYGARRLREITFFEKKGRVSWLTAGKARHLMGKSDRTEIRAVQARAPSPLSIVCTAILGRLLPFRLRRSKGPSPAATGTGGALITQRQAAASVGNGCPFPTACKFSCAPGRTAGKFERYENFRRGGKLRSENFLLAAYTPPLRIPYGDTTRICRDPDDPLDSMIQGPGCNSPAHAPRRPPTP